LEITRRHQTGIWLAKIDRLIDAPDGSPEAEYLDVLSTLVEAYEEQHYPIPLPDPIEYILYYMESRGLTHQELEPYLGSRRQVADVLNKTQPLSMKMIRKLQHGLDMAGEILIQPYNLLQSQEPVRLGMDLCITFPIPARGFNPALKLGTLFNSGSLLFEPAFS
jgi:HTH-type transcriptional regulator/antitoxin HigA